MDDDNLYPGDGTYYGIPREPQEQVNARKKERAKTLEVVNELKKVIDHFEERIEFRDKLSSVNVDITRDAALHQKVCEVNSMLKLALEEEKHLLEELLEVHSR